MLDQQLRQRCHDKIKALRVPDPFDLEQFRISLERQRHRVLQLVPTQTTPECSGLWIALPAADYIFYEQHTTQLHRLHIIGHETGHMVFGHHQVPVSDSEFACLLFPDLSQELIRSMLARSGYTDAEEEEAEAFASLLMERIAPDLHVPASPEAEARMCRVESAFGRGPRWN